MKRLISLLLLLTISTASFSQSATATTSQLKTDYLKKSKHQKTAANMLLYGGATCWITCFFIIPNIKWGPAGAEGIFYTTFGVGLIAMPASIPFFINSSRYKKKGMSLSIKNETIPQVSNRNFVYKAVPSLTLKIGL